MAQFIRYRPVITGFVGAPGINTWHGEAGLAAAWIDEAQGWADAVRAVYFACKAYLAPGVTVTFPGEATIHDEATGSLLSASPVVAPANVVSTATAAEGQDSRATQSLVQLHTAVVRNGRRLQGRHFLGPASSFCFDSNGQTNQNAKNGIQAAYGGVVDIAGAGLVVWGPPIYEKNSAGEPTDVLISAGKKGSVTAVSVSSIPGTLRSRKG